LAQDLWKFDGAAWTLISVSGTLFLCWILLVMLFLDSIPSSRASAVGTGGGGFFYMYGGETYTGPSSEFWEFDTQGEKWKLLSNTSTIR
jgi:hypothetical protein